MDTSSPQQSVVLTLVRHILPFFPPSLHELIEHEAPALSLSAVRLGFEVLDAERQEVPFSAAVERVAEFPLMGRAYFGVINLLQWRVTPPIREALQGVLNHALEGKFDSLRKLLFVIAQRRADPEAALCRFVLWAAVRINLLILTWHRPKVEATGVLHEMEDRAQEVLTRLLDGNDIHEPDCRPLHMLIAQVLEDAFAAAAPLLMGAMTAIEAELADAMQKASSAQRQRSLVERCSIATDDWSAILRGKARLDGRGRFAIEWRAPEDPILWRVPFGLKYRSLPGSRRRIFRNRCFIDHGEHGQPNG